MLCNLLEGAVNPSPWISSAQKEYVNMNYTVPWYLSTTSTSSLGSETNKKFSDVRSRFQGNDAGELDELFMAEITTNPTYNAYEKDIGIINVYFGQRDGLKYETANRMGYSDFIYQIGGSLGFVMGVSMISIVELFYWIFFRVLGNIVN